MWCERTRTGAVGPPPKYEGGGGGGDFIGRSNSYLRRWQRREDDPADHPTATTTVEAAKIKRVRNTNILAAARSGTAAKINLNCMDSFLWAVSLPRKKQPIYLKKSMKMYHVFYMNSSHCS